MELITAVVLVYIVGACFTALVTVMTMPLKAGLGAAIWWPIVWIYFIFAWGMDFINWTSE